jgi:hypothetical protein
MSCYRINWTRIHRNLTLTLMLWGGLSPCQLVARANDDRENSQHVARVDRAIDRALEALKALQDKNQGCWLDQHKRPNPAVTGLAVMAFLSAGHVPGEGRYGSVVEKGIRWVLRKQKANGLISGDDSFEMYHHGIATLMLAEAAGMTDADLGEAIRKAVAKAVRVILIAQRTKGYYAGGWRYRAAADDSDISVTGWQVMALRAARNLGCDVPSESIDRAIAFIKRCHDQGSGGFRYHPGPGAHTSAGTTGTSILALEICGKEHHLSPESLRGGAYLLGKDVQMNTSSEWFFYALYYGSQATFQLGGNYWKDYRPRLHDKLLPIQDRGGFWDGGSPDAQEGGRAYCTAMAILALTVEYRFLPIYQRDEEPAKK